MSVPLSTLRDNIQSRLQFTKSKLLTFGLFVLWETVIDAIGTGYNIWLRLSVGATVISFALIDQSIYKFLKEGFPKIAPLAYKLLMGAIIIWLIWPRYEHWFGQTTDRVVLAEKVISPCGGSVPFLGGRIIISWIDRHPNGTIRMQIEDLDSDPGKTTKTLSRGESWPFTIEESHYSLLVRKWPKNREDTVILSVVKIPRISATPSEDTKTDTANTAKPPPPLCKWYTVTFTELEVEYHNNRGIDSVGFQFKAKPRFDSLWLIIDTIGIYLLNIKLEPVAPLKDIVLIEMRQFDPPLTVSDKVYNWPVAVKGWGRNKPETIGNKEIRLSNPFVIYKLRYSVECVEDST